MFGWFGFVLVCFWFDFVVGGLEVGLVGVLGFAGWVCFVIMWCSGLLFALLGLLFLGVCCVNLVCLFWVGVVGLFVFVGYCLFMLFLCLGFGLAVGWWVLEWVGC